MAEQSDEKFKLPLTGLVALVVAAVSSLLIFQVPLKTARPIDKEAEKTAYVMEDRVQSRLWQDPFEALSTHQLKEAASKSTQEGRAKTHRAFSDLLQAIKSTVDASEFLVLPVFVDGSPYANGVESRLKDRYAVVSALGVAGYLPESGEYIRYFEWSRSPTSSLLVPVEWFLPDSNSRHSPGSEQVLVLWLKDQDFSPHPLATLEELVAELTSTVGQDSTRYKVLGPRTSGTLASMLSELQPSELTRHPLGLTALQGTTFYSSWATAANEFLLAPSPQDAERQEVEDMFAKHGLSLLRTIGTDAALAEQLVEELKRRHVDLTIRPEGTTPRRAPHVALISEWDTLYGRALPLTFVAMAETMAKTTPASGSKQIGAELEVLRAGVWPEWVHRYSYLAGLDGELPPKGDGKEAAASPAKGKPGDKISGAQQSAEEVPTGRSQLDYVRRLAETLRRDSTNFAAIGVLGSDVYDKLMILQALRNDFPQAIFFTTDLDARLTHSGQGQWTRNLIVASHFGLALHPDLQTPIPPFRDSYQTALFYSALQAVEYLLPLPVEHEEVRNSVTHISYSIAGRPRLYEIGRHGAVDMSVDEPRDIPSLHAPRADINLATGGLRMPDSGRVWWTLVMLGAVMFCALLLNSQVLDFFRERRHRDKLVIMFGLGVIMTGFLWWAIQDGVAGEPFTLTEGISVWPTTFIRLAAFLLCMLFLRYAWSRLRDNDRVLTRKFGLQPPQKQSAAFHRLLGIHYWRPHPGGDISASDLWQEYQSLGQGKNRFIRILAQTLCYGLFGFALMQLFGFPAMPCRGPTCFQLNYFMLALSVIGMTLLMFYVVDATRLCRRLIKIMISTKIAWPHAVLAREAVHHDVDRSVLNEWLGIELIAERTAVISFMLYYPFIILFLMGVARHTYFDRWDFPLSLMVIFGLNAMYALGNAIYLRHSAEEAKRTALAQLRTKLVGLPDESVRRKQIERIADLIDRNREGAFLPFTQHPIFGAIALPTGGTGLVLLIEYLATIM